MNDEPLDEFASYVRRAVGPVAAFVWRKRLMQEELVAHLMESYQEELARLGNEAAAAELAKKRLGNSDELSRRLQAVVPIIERLGVVIVGGKESIMSRWIWLAAILAVLIGTGLVLPAMAKYKQQNAPISEVAPLLLIGALIVLSGLGTIGYGIKRRFTRAA
jgi:hypothetical protein